MIDELLTDTQRRALRYLESLAERPVAADPAAVAALAGFDEPLPTEGLDPREVIARLDALGSPATVASAGGRYFGFVTGGALPAALAASWLTTAWDQNGALAVMSPVAATLDELALRWTVEALGLPAGTGGAFVTGATMANTTALAAARDHLLTRAGWDPGDGLFGAPPIDVFVGDEVHSTVSKALGLVGLGRKRVRTLPTDSQGRIAASQLPELRGPAVVVLQAGNVNSGAFDPFEPLIDWARAAEAWVHVDGAFGLWAAASPRCAPLTAGLAGADSWATDGHKQLNTTYDCGIALVREPSALTAAMALTASYLPTGGQRDAMQHTPQSSQRARGVEVWAALKSLGRSGLAALVERCCDHAARFAKELADSGAEVLNEVVFNQVVVAFGDDADTSRVIAGVQAEGTCWCGPTTWRGRKAMRISVSSWATTAADVTASIAAIRRVAAAT